MKLRSGARIRDWGYGTVGADEVIEGRVITAYDPKAKEPWYLVTDLDDAEAEEIVSIYRRRWWIETVLRDSKNRDWGLGLDKEAKANTRTTRVLNLLRIGIYYIKRRGQQILDAVETLKIRFFRFEDTSALVQRIVVASIEP